MHIYTLYANEYVHCNLHRLHPKNSNSLECVCWNIFEFSSTFLSCMRDKIATILDNMFKEGLYHTFNCLKSMYQSLQPSIPMLSDELWLYMWLG